MISAFLYKLNGKVNGYYSTYSGFTKCIAQQILLVFAHSEEYTGLASNGRTCKKQTPFQDQLLSYKYIQYSIWEKFPSF